MFRKLMILPVALLAFACSKDNKANDALNSDLTTAAQANPTTPLDSISAAERARALNSPGATRTTTAPVRRTTTTTRRTTSSSGGGTVSQPAPTVVRNTKRDAAIGAAAGAVIGATTSKDKLKGGIIGAVAGGILGGVIGNNVDVKKKY